MKNIDRIKDEQLSVIDAGGICWAGVTAAIAGVCAGVAITVASGGTAPAAIGLLYLASIACSAGATYDGCQ